LSAARPTAVDHHSRGKCGCLDVSFLHVPPRRHEVFVLSQRSHEVGFWDDRVRYPRSLSRRRCLQRSRAGFRFFPRLPLRQRIRRYALHTEDLNVIPVATWQCVCQPELSVPRLVCDIREAHVRFRFAFVNLLTVHHETSGRLTVSDELHSA